MVADIFRIAAAERACLPAYHSTCCAHTHTALRYTAAQRHAFLHHLALRRALHGVTFALGWDHAAFQAGSVQALPYPDSPAPSHTNSALTVTFSWTGRDACLFPAAHTCCCMRARTRTARTLPHASLITSHPSALRDHVPNGNLLCFILSASGTSILPGALRHATAHRRVALRRGAMSSGHSGETDIRTDGTCRACPSLYRDLSSACLGLLPAPHTAAPATTLHTTYLPHTTSSSDYHSRRLARYRTYHTPGVLPIRTLSSCHHSLRRTGCCPPALLIPFPSRMVLKHRKFLCWFAAAF